MAFLPPQAQVEDVLSGVDVAIHDDRLASAPQLLKVLLVGAHLEAVASLAFTAMSADSFPLVDREASRRRHLGLGLGRLRLRGELDAAHLHVRELVQHLHKDKLRQRPTKKRVISLAIAKSDRGGRWESERPGGGPWRCRIRLAFVGVDVL